MGDHENVGIVIIGRNEGQRLIACLRSLPPIPGPVVYVDSGSTDGSAEAAGSLGATAVQLDLAKPFTAARARNEGFCKVRSIAPDTSFVQFLDGDCTMADEWLAVAMAFLRDQSTVAIACGRRRERYPGNSVYNQLIDQEWNTAVGEAEACGGDALVRVAAFEAVGGFNPALMAGEEPEMCSRLRRAGWTIWRLDADMTVHDAAILHFSQWWHRAVRSGYGYAQVWATTRSTAIVLYKRELLRAVTWAGAVPLAIFLGIIISPVLGIAGIALYAVQIARIAAKGGLTKSLSWVYASQMVLGKFAELSGAGKYVMAKIGRQTRSSIDYKSA